MATTSLKVRTSTLKRRLKLVITSYSIHYTKLYELLSQIEGDAGKEPRLQACIQHARLRFGNIGSLSAMGLHQFLDQFLEETHALAESIHRAYLEAI